MVLCRQLFALVIFAAVQPAAAQVDVNIPRTEYGQPDMQGVWFYGSGTPFERPESLGNQLNYTEAEASSFIDSLLTADEEKAEPLDPNRSAPEQGGAIAQAADHNFSVSRLNAIRIDGALRTSQIVSPSNGRFPYREGYQDYFQSWLAQGYGAYDGPEVRPVSERCVGPNGGPMAPMIGWFYNANMQIVQAEDYVLFNIEMNHDARIIPLNSSAEVPDYGTWMGHSRGHWDGDTLVVRTSGFRPEQSWFALRMSDQLEVEERYTLLSRDEILYQFTLTDPAIYSEPVTVEKTISRREEGERIYEYACHEGNYSFSSILAGARRLELEADGL